MNPVDWGSTPFAVGLIRGIIAAALTGASAGLAASMNGIPQETSIQIGLAAMIPPMLVLLGYGASDQSRANRGIANAGDVTIAAVAKATHQQAQVVADEFTEAVNPE